MSEIYLTYDHYCDYADEATEEYGNSTYSYSFNTGGFAYFNRPSSNVVRGSSTEAFSYSGGPDLVAGETIYAVTAVWSTGDSFTSSSGARFDFCIVNRDPEKAEANRKLLEDAESSVTLVRDDGSHIQYHPGWLGYFENLDHATVNVYTVK